MSNDSLNDNIQYCAKVLLKVLSTSKAMSANSFYRRFQGDGLIRSKKKKRIMQSTWSPIFIEKVLRMLEEAGIIEAINKRFTEKRVISPAGQVLYFKERVYDPLSVKYRLKK